MKIGAIVQARMSSERLPGKVLCKVKGKAILEYVLERINCCKGLDTVVIATSKDDSDTLISNFCKERGVECYRGSLLNVAGRFKEALDIYNFDAFVRVNGDSPLLDHRLIEKGVGIFLQGDFDVVTNTLIRTYPKGQSVEILRGDVFRSAYELMRKDDEFEHVTRYFYENKDDFRIFNFESSQNRSGIQLSIDTHEDLNRFASIVSRMKRPHSQYRLSDILQLARL